MKISITCDSCEQKIKLDYDESTCNPEYCPFCGEELNNEDGDFEIEDTQEDDMEEY